MVFDLAAAYRKEGRGQAADHLRNAAIRFEEEAKQIDASLRKQRHNLYSTAERARAQKLRDSARLLITLADQIAELLP